MLKKLTTIAMMSMALFTGCDGDKSTTKKPTIAIVPKAYDVGYWKIVHGGVAKAAVENPKYAITWQPPAVNGDSSSQSDTVENLTVSQFDAIALCPIDEGELLKSVEGAKKSGSKVLLWDSGLAKEDSIETFIATDNTQGGKLCAQALAKALGEKGGSVIMLRYTEGSASTTKRENGFLKEIKKHSAIKYLELNQRGGLDEATAKDKSEIILTANTGITGIFCPNQTTTEGMLLALKQLKLNGKIKLVGFDISEPITAAIKNGDLVGSAAQDPFRMGYLAVTKSIEVLEGKTVEKRIDTGVTIITKENIDSAAMKEILFPNYNKWIKQMEQLSK